MHLLVVIIKEGISGVTHKRVSFYGTLNLRLNPQVIPHSRNFMAMRGVEPRKAGNNTTASSAPAIAIKKSP